MTENASGIFTLNRRQFVGASAVVGGLVASESLIACSAPDQQAAGADTTVTVTVNGAKQTVPVDNRTSLLDMVRERLRLTGTKKGCNQGACGACTIMLDGRRVNSCLTLAVMHDGAEITTVEGLASGDQLHPLQQAFIDQDAFQCGYCTSGQIVSGVGCIAERHTGSRDEIREWMSGNICRCGAYPNIVSAVQQAARTT
jgi:xanthine dehydrogenase YagT iron-sulfur-binding subunit